VREKFNHTEQTIFQREKETKRISNHKRSGRTAAKHGETEAREKSSKLFQTHSSIPEEGVQAEDTLMR
jgi:hypothetical protein